MKSFTLTAIMATVLSTALRAQDDVLPDIDIDINENEWYENPVLWIAVAGFFILLIVLTRRKSA